MLKSYFKASSRFLWKNKTFSIVNIAGLATGTLCCLYIVMFVADQYCYDKHFVRANDIYRITFIGKTPGNNPTRVGTCSPPIAPALKKDFGEVQQFTRVVKADAFGAKQHLLQYKNKSFYETDAVYADSTFFDIFTFHFLGGSASSALIQPYSVVLLQPVAMKLFGSEDPIGKVITIDNAYGRHDFKVTGVVDESLGKSHLHANLFMQMNSGGMGDYTSQSQSWAGDNFTFSYIRLSPQADAIALEEKLPAFLNKYGAEQLKTFGMEKQLHLQPVSAIHTTSGYNHDEHSVSSSFLYFLLLIGVLIQIIACINFMNLSTAQASRRAKEVAVRKVIGAGNKDLIWQFLGESFLLTFLSVGIALPLLIFALPFFNQITEADIGLRFLSDYRLWVTMGGLVIMTGFVAGSYPAFYLSEFRATNIIKGNFASHISADGIRRSLVVFQFVLSISLITAIIVIYNQLAYIKEKDLGFDKNQKLIFSFYTADVQDQVPSFMNDLRQLAEIKVVSKANNYLGQPVPNGWEYSLAGGNAAVAQETKIMFTDEFFVKASGIHLLSGRDFRQGDSAKVLINETFARKLGLTVEKAPGTRIYPKLHPGDPISFLEIAGVMKNFNYSSLRDNLNSFMLMYQDRTVKAAMEGKSNVIVSTGSKDYKTLLKKIQAIWHNSFPTLPFEYTFQDEAVQQQYKTEMVLSRIINVFTLIAIMISCLGLFGLSAFQAEQRNKEISVRKVLGAGVGSLMALLSKDFLKLVAVALLIAIPIAWWVMNKWLQGFVYRISFRWWMFALSGMLSIMISLITVSFQTVKAAVANPIKGLRSE